MILRAKLDKSIACQVFNFFNFKPETKHFIKGRCNYLSQALESAVHIYQGVHCELANVSNILFICQMQGEVKNFLTRKIFQNIICYKAENLFATLV